MALDLSIRVSVPTSSLPMEVGSMEYLARREETTASDEASARTTDKAFSEQR